MLKLALTQTSVQRSTPFHNGVPLEAICITTMKNEKNGRKNAENGRRKMLNAESVKAKEKFGAAQQTICNWRKDTRCN